MTYSSHSSSSYLHQLSHHQSHQSAQNPLQPTCSDALRLYGSRTIWIFPPVRQAIRDLEIFLDKVRRIHGHEGLCATAARLHESGHPTFRHVARLGKHHD